MTTTSATPALIEVSRPADGSVVVRLGGDWLLRESLPSTDEVADSLQGAPAGTTLQFDAQALGKWDSGLLTVLLQLAERAHDMGVRIDTSSLPKGLSRLLELARTVPDQTDTHAVEEEGPEFLEWVGFTTLSAQVSVGRTLEFVGQAAMALGRFALGKARIRRSDLWLLIQQAGVEALAIVTLVNLLIGMILAFVGAIQLEAFGASIYVANLVGIAMVRDIAALMTAIVMAGRSGAAYAAQLGTMKVNEEIDAYRTMGIDPLEFLVLPRMVALTLMMPLLTLYGDVTGIIGGMVVGLTMLDISATAYVQQTLGAIDVTQLVGGVFKGATYGLLVAIAGCLRGMESGRSAGAVGAAATSAVVTGIVWIIAAAGLYSYLFYLLGL